MIPLRWDHSTLLPRLLVSSLTNIHSLFHRLTILPPSFNTVLHTLVLISELLFAPLVKVLVGQYKPILIIGFLLCVNIS